MKHVALAILKLTSFAELEIIRNVGSFVGFLQPEGVCS